MVGGEDESISERFFREILKNKGRFLSVFFISLLGAAFFSGIRSAEGDMKTSADAYYDQTNYMDLRVLGTLGLTDTDMEDIAKVKGVAQVTGGHTLEVLHKEGEKEQTVKLIALEDGVNEPQILDGRLPQKTDEILVDQKFLDGTGKRSAIRWYLRVVRTLHFRMTLFMKRLRLWDRQRYPIIWN